MRSTRFGMLRALLLVGAVALPSVVVSCSGTNDPAAANTLKSYEEPPKFRQSEGKDWKIVSPTRQEQLIATTDVAQTIPVTYEFSKQFIDFSCSLTVSLRWLPLDGGATADLAGVVKNEVVTRPSLTITVPQWPTADQRDRVAGRSTNLTIRNQISCPGHQLDFEIGHTVRVTFPSLTT